jgi:hypothetical protein
MIISKDGDEHLYINNSYLVSITNVCHLVILFILMMNICNISMHFGTADIEPIEKKGLFFYVWETEEGWHVGWLI